jgi:outer membrane receptor protein involved in Fe transport
MTLLRSSSAIMPTQPYHFGLLAAILQASLLLASACAQVAPERHSLRGVVRDPMGAAIAGAQVELRAGGFSGSVQTDAGGIFLFDSVPTAAGKLMVRANRFTTAERRWNRTPTALEIVLAPAGESDKIVVTATRTETPLSDVAGSAVALASQDLSATSALLLDDKLRQVPGFILFRRSSSRTANPTSQGVSLNGLGASGASRALVLEDGVSLNDPFGGWVYWDRVPAQALESVELVRGGISSLYGSNALGGVIQFLSRQPERPAFSLETSYGSEQTPDLSLWAGERRGPGEGSLAADLFHTDGYVLVPLAQRGSVDTAANTEHASLILTLGRRFGGSNRVFGRGSFFTEARHNGTPIQTNDTQLAEAVLGADTHWAAMGPVSVRVYGQVQGYNQNFSSIAANRTSEALTDRQHVPVERLGESAWWSRPAGHLQTLVAGVDSAEVLGWSDEAIFSAVSGAHTANTIAGGRQRTAGVYGEDVFRITSTWVITMGARLDHWRNFDAQSLRTSLPSVSTAVTPFAERSENAFSPRLSVLHQITGNLSFTASIERAFRSPTLNELYRSFRLGNVLTQANSNLEAERLTGAEAGASVYAFERKLHVRGNFFWDDVVDPVANVTLTTTPSLITRQRRNLGRTRSRGVDLDAAMRLAGPLAISGGYQFADATVAQFPANTSLIGLQIPEVPRHQFTVQARYLNPSFLMVSVQGRFVGAQFDDDQNTLKLDRYFTMDAQAGKALGRGFEAFVAVENLLNQRYSVSLTPIPNLGPPFLARAGVRFNFPPRN